jgi:ParB family chromosome partitioning protein
LPAPIQKGLVSGDITAGHARALLSVENSTEQFRLFNKIARENMSVRQVEREVQRLSGGEKKRHGQSGSGASQGFRAEDPVMLDLLDRLRKHLGTQVKIVHDDTNKGEIKIEFYSAGDMERLIELILGDRGE